MTAPKIKPVESPEFSASSADASHSRLTAEKAKKHATAAQLAADTAAKNLVFAQQDNATKAREAAESWLAADTAAQAAMDSLSRHLDIESAVPPTKENDESVSR